MRAREGEEFLPARGVVAQQAVDRRRDGGRSRRRDAADRHALVLGFEHDADPLGREMLLQPVGDLLRQPFLHLEVAREQRDDARELRQPHDACVGDVPDVRDSRERQQVVLAQRTERDVRATTSSS